MRAGGVPSQTHTSKFLKKVARLISTTKSDQQIRSYGEPSLISTYRLIKIDLE